MRAVYLDNAATTPADPAVVEAMLPYFTGVFGNASSIHTFGQKARTAVEDARAQVAALMGADPREVVFTSGGTESDNAALRGAAWQLGRPGSHIVTTRIEHSAVLATCRRLEAEGFEVTYLPVDAAGRVDPGEVAAAITPRTVLVSVMHANNEIGTLQPLEEICAAAEKSGVLVHSDCVQTLGKIPVDLRRLPVHLASFSAHKLHGPKGVGALFVRRGVQLQPLVLGGSHERRRRAGTENVTGIVGFGKAAELAAAHLGEMATRIGGLRDRLQEGLLRIPGSMLNGHPELRAPHILNMSFQQTEGEGLVVSLDLEGIAVSTGAACASGSVEPSHVLLALGRSRRDVHGSLRFSFGRMNTVHDVDRTLEALPRIVERIRAMSPSAPAR